MIMMYKILHGLDGIPFDELSTILLQDSYKLHKNFCHLNCRKYFFSQWIINDWNNLPQEVIESDNIWTFKSKLDISTTHKAGNILDLVLNKQ